MISKFDEMKIKYTYSEYPGGHTWPVWRNNLYKIIRTRVIQEINYEQKIAVSD
jgi:enterochelin esterase-like enzyme